jgi:hypothetical protein
MPALVAGTHVLFNWKKKKDVADRAFQVKMRFALLPGKTSGWCLL